MAGGDRLTRGAVAAATAGGLARGAVAMAGGLARGAVASAMARGLTFGAAALGLCLGAAGCAPRLGRRVAPSPQVGAAPAASADPLADLRAWESATRARTDFAHVQTSDVALGTDPYVIRRLGSAGTVPRFVGILRGRSQLVELDASLHEVGRWAAPASPTGLAVTAQGDVFAVGELSSRVARFRSTASGRLEPVVGIELPGVRAMRDVTTGPEGVVYVVEEHDGRLIAIRPGPDGESRPAERVDIPLCHGPVHVLRVARRVLVDCLLDHEVVLRSVDDRGFPEATNEVRIPRDGPIWGIDAVAEDERVLLAVGGVEDHPLDRTEGSFGFIDSFVTLYSVKDSTATKLADVNTSAFGVVTPKALKMTRPSPRGLEVVAAGYGSDRMAILDWVDADRPATPTVRTRPILPGSAMIEGGGDGSWVIANPLLDAWVHETAGDRGVIPVEDAMSRSRTVDSRVGEALFFTTLMAPWNRSDGRLSRFTCETCHFEGYVDGRIHRTGRGDVLATTKPLAGLFNNRPHFSRALDPDLTTMVNNEFRVAGAHSDHDPWFSLSTDDFPWVRYLGVDQAILPPEVLRRSLMSFFIDFAPRPNPSVVGRPRWSDAERVGAAVFRDRCESCHEARLVADDESTRVAFDRWEPLVMAPEGAIVWARAEYEKTGVIPYVNERGARVVSLRRLYKKHPYFTNGTADDVRAVLDRARVSGGQFFHEGGPESSERLSEGEKAALVAFLDLL